MSSRAQLEENLADCLGRIDRTRAEATLVAVTKTVEPEVALALAALGVTDLGESRVPELERKHAAFEAAGVDVRWHFIGHLQRNKARRVVRLAYALHSVDSLRLLEAIGRLRDEEGRAPHLFLQVKLNDEENKTGFAPIELESALERAGELKLSVLGLMTMAPLAEGPQQLPAARETFQRLNELSRTLPASAFSEGRPLLSMGMSGDFEEALREGSDYVRVGSALFRGLPRSSSDPARIALIGGSRNDA